MIALARIIQPTGQTGLPKRLQCGNNGGMAARKTKGTNGGAAASTAPDKGSRAREAPQGNAQVGDTAAVWTSLDDLHGWPRNPRKNQDTVWRVVALIIKFGFGRPVGARRANGELVWGHTATAAAHQLAREWATAAPEERGRWHKDAVLIATERIIPVRFGDWSEQEAHALAIADNRAQEFSSWDNELLAQELGDLSLAQAHLLGWSGESLEKMVSFKAKGSSGADEPLGENGFEHKGQCGVIVMAKDEQDQEKIFNELQELGYECRVVNV